MLATPIELFLLLSSTLAGPQAEGEPPPEGSAGGAPDMWLLLIALVAVFYFVMILPEKKNRKKRNDMLATLKKGDKVLTTSGIYGSVAMVKDDVVTLQVADGVRMRFSRAAIQSVLAEDPEGADTKEAGSAS